MIQGDPQTTVLDDIEFLKENYKVYFSALEILQKSEECVKFRISPVDDPLRYADSVDLHSTSPVQVV
jgi:hypothetical protein